MATILPNINRRPVNIDYVAAGRMAFKLGVSSFASPYGPRDPRGKQWLEGYVEAKRAAAKAQPNLRTRLIHQR